MLARTSGVGAKELVSILRPLVLSDPPEAFFAPKQSVSIDVILATWSALGMRWPVLAGVPVAEDGRPAFSFSSALVILSHPLLRFEYIGRLESALLTKKQSNEEFTSSVTLFKAAAATLVKLEAYAQTAKPSLDLIANISDSIACCDATLGMLPTHACLHDQPIYANGFYSSAGVVLYCWHEDNVFVLLGFEPSKNGYCYMLGGLDPMETVTVCAARELNEETAGVYSIPPRELLEMPFVDHSSAVFFVECKYVPADQLDIRAQRHRDNGNKHFAEMHEYFWASMDSLVKSEGSKSFDADGVNNQVRFIRLRSGVANLFIRARKTCFDILSGDVISANPLEPNLSGY